MELLALLFGTYFFLAVVVALTGVVLYGYAVYDLFRLTAARFQKRQLQAPKTF